LLAGYVGLDLRRSVYAVALEEIRFPSSAAGERHAR
jgi:hypothetical protein